MSALNAMPIVSSLAITGAAVGGEMDAPGAPVVLVAAPLDQPGFLEPVDHPAQA